MTEKIKRKKSLYLRLQDNEKFQSSMMVVLPIIFGIAVFMMWQGGALHGLFGTDEFTLPYPTKIGVIIADNIEKIIENSISTITVAALGLLLGSILGYVIALLAASFPKIGMGGLSVIGAFASIPVVALAPVFNNWTKDISSDAQIRSMVAKIIVVMLIAAADMGINAYRGLTELKPYSQDLMVTYAANRRVIFFKLRFPNSLPYIFDALKVSVPASIMTAIVSEYFAEYITGVGRAIRENIVLAQYSTAWAYIATACAIGILSYAVLMIVQGVVLRRYR